MYINIVHFFSKTLGGGGGENNPMRSSIISDQCYFYAKYDKNAYQLEHVFFKFLMEQNNTWH